MPADRDATIRKAEKLRAQGKLAGAIAEYLRLVEGRPDDWALVNTLGDVYAEAGQRDSAIARFRLVGDHLFDEGFYPRAAAVYKKILKVRSDEDHALSRLAAIAERQRLPFEARAYLERLVTARNARRDEIGAAEILVRLAAVDAADEPLRVPGSKVPVARAPESAVKTVLEDAHAVVEPPASPADPAEPPASETAEPERSAPDDAEPPAGVAPAPPPRLEDVFGAMRARVGGSQEARAREQYEQAVRWLDEGRVVEAVAGLEEAARAPFVRFEAASRLGRLFVEQGDLAAAVGWMERAAEVPPPTPEAGTELLYDLADALEQVGERARALAVLREIEAGVGEYRDVRERIDWLSETAADGEQA